MSSAIDSLNDALAGSPYLLEDDDRGAARAEFLLSECARIAERHSIVEVNFASESEEIRNRVLGMLSARLVYESNAIELAGLPLVDTEKALSQAPKSLNELANYNAKQAVRADKHLIEVLGLQEAMLFARQLAADFATSETPIREVDIRSLHRSTVPMETFAGSYRSVEVAIQGSEHVPPNVVEVPTQMHQLVEWLNSTSAPPPLAAAVVHSWLTIIHPFEDGNGRVARLLANVVLLRSGWPPLIIRSSDRLQYLDALGASDEAGNLLPLFDLFIKSIKWTLRELEKPDLAQRLFNADLRKNPDMRYELWWALLDQFLDELRRNLRTTGLDFIRLRVPDISTFILLEDSDPSGNTWLAKAIGPNQDLLLWLGFMSHASRDAWASRGGPSLFFSLRDSSEDAVHPYLNPFEHGSPIEIEELTILPKAVEKPALLRRGGITLTEHSIAEAAKILAVQLVG